MAVHFSSFLKWRATGKDSPEEYNSQNQNKTFHRALFYTSTIKTRRELPVKFDFDLKTISP
jgi:hypothetical protein